MEKERRKKRYKDLYLRNKKHKEELQEEAEKRKLKETENLPITLANANFQKLVRTIDGAIDKCKKNEMIFKNTKDPTCTFPHSTTKETNHMANDKARVITEFFKERLLPEAELDISSDSLTFNTSKASNKTELSTDDEDNMEVGQKGSKFKLRGFQFKLGSNLRGKLHQHEKVQGAYKEQLCITRDQWLKELNPKQKVKLDIEMGIQKLRNPDDPQFVLFPQAYGFKPPKAKLSAIREFRAKPLGRHYERRLRKNLKITKPRLRYTVKKFNFISYRFGDELKRFSHIKDSIKNVETLQTTSEYLEAKARNEKLHQELIKQNRLQLLGIPCKPIKKSKLQTKCENFSSESDIEWVPERDDQTSNDLKKSKIPLTKCSNMPAPKYREPTLRQHPRRSRNYVQERVPSDIFDQVVLTSNVPHMYKLPKDMVNFVNADLKKTPYTEMFEGRHHHDHWNPTQHTQIDVHYHAKVVKPEITQIKRKSDRVVTEHFQMANPPCNQFVEMNLTMPEWDIDEIIKEHKKTPKKHTVDKQISKLNDFYNERDYVLRTQDLKEFEGIYL